MVTIDENTLARYKERRTAALEFLREFPILKCAREAKTIDDGHAWLQSFQAVARCRFETWFDIADAITDDEMIAARLDRQA